MGISSLDWPENSPDLNPIEHFWSIMKKKMQKRRATNINDLKNNIASVWNGISIDDIINNLYDRIPKRILEIIKNKGNITKY